MHSIVIRANKIVQNPLQFQNNASGIPTRYRDKHMASNRIFVIRESLIIINKNAPEPIEFSSLVAIDGNISMIIMIVIKLFPTTIKETVENCIADKISNRFHIYKSIMLSCYILISTWR
jgi:hypothetical protein